MKYYLAPLEGLTTDTFRRVWNQYYGGMDKYFTPFLSNRNLSSRERNDILPEHNIGMHTIPQILTNKAEEFLTLSAELAAYGYDTVNLNLGCPSGTVVARNRGAGFLAVPDALEAFLDEIFEKCPLKISIKTRIGMSDISEWEGLLSLYAKYPIEELIIHPRLQKEGYSGIPHKEAFARACESLPFPLCYNGDITTLSALDSLLSEFENTKMEAVMIGRGILRQPGFLAEIKGSQPSTDSLTTLRKFHDTLLESYRQIMSGDTNTLYKMKDLWTFLSNSFEHPEKHLKKIRKATRITEYQIAVDALFRECPFLH